MGDKVLLPATEAAADAAVALTPLTALTALFTAEALSTAEATPELTAEATALSTAVAVSGETAEFEPAARAERARKRETWTICILNCWICFVRGVLQMFFQYL